MTLRPHRKILLFATMLMASLGCLQPGIDPVFLTLLSIAHPIDPASHGWIVGATQAGMALGSVIIWRADKRLTGFYFASAGGLAVLASLATAQTGALIPLLAIRFGYGLAMGMFYTRAMSAAAAWRPNGAYGGVFLIQLVLSTVLALALPLIANRAGPATALAALAFAPLLAVLLFLVAARTAQPVGAEAPKELAERRYPVDASAWALAAASLLFICATMMVWSFAGAMAAAAQITEDVIGSAVAIGAIAGALTAIAVSREKLLVSISITGILAGLSLLAPIPGAASGDAGLFIFSIVLFNIGSTAIIIRCSGLATARSLDPLFRRLVACTHALGMILGPVTGSILTISLGEPGLLGGAIVFIVAGCLSLILSSRWQGPQANVRTGRFAWGASRWQTPAGTLLRQREDPAE